MVPASLMPLRRDDLAGLADLQVAGHIAGIDRGARSADGSAEPVGQLEDDLEVLLRADATATGDHALGALQVRAVAGTGGQADEAGVGRQRGVDAGRFDGGTATLGGFRPGRGTHGGNHDLVGRGFDGDDRVAGVDRALEGVAAFDAHQPKVVDGPHTWV
ncbi:hypothetical protein G6F31_019027 [Rhizopus arrhizus]|nr:hypothetical protein G6F31_019027 [Rhizopus arrhizus]